MLIPFCWVLPVNLGGIFSHLKTSSETDLGKEFHASEITRYTVEAAPRWGWRKVDLVMRVRGSTCRRPGKASSEEVEAQARWQDVILSKCLLTTGDHGTRPYARYWGARDESHSPASTLQKLIGSSKWLGLFFPSRGISKREKRILNLPFWPIWILSSINKK